MQRSHHEPAQHSAVDSITFRGSPFEGVPIFLWGDNVKELREEGGRYSLRTLYDTDPILRKNMEARKEGRGFSSDGNARRVASIPLEDMMRLITEKNQDALAAMRGDDKALRRLIRAHPEWRTSEGGI